MRSEENVLDVFLASSFHRGVPSFEVLSWLFVSTMN